MQPRSERGLVWCASDWRSLLPGGSAGLMQLMYPPLGHAVMEHSEFVEDPFGRVYRSIPQIWATILTRDGEQRGRHIRDLHRDVKGTDDNGRRYHALDPDTFWWAHATFTWEMYRSIELFHRRQLTTLECERLYGDTVEWYQRYGVSMRPVPESHGAFEDRFREICLHELELTPAVQYAIDIAEGGDVAMPLIPPAALRTLRPVLKSPARAIVFGCMPREVRHRFDLPWTDADRRALRLFRLAVRNGIGALPTRVNRRTMRWTLRQVGARTRDERYVPAA